MRRSVGTTLLSILVYAAAGAADADRTRVQLSEPGRPADLRVEIEWGSIRVLADPEASELTIDVRGDRADEINGGFVTISEASNVVAIKQAPLPKGTFRSANLEIRVPVETSADLRMNRGGDIRLQGLRGLVEVTNLNGSVEITDLAGAAAVNASNGAISASFTQVDPGRDMLFASLNGSVELCLPPTYGGRLHLTTAGDPIRIEFPVERQESSRLLSPGETVTLDSSEISGRIGSGEAWLRASTLNGEIAIRRCE